MKETTRYIGDSNLAVLREDGMLTIVREVSPNGDTVQIRIDPLVLEHLLDFLWEKEALPAPYTAVEGEQ